MNTVKEELIRALYDTGAVRFGSFKLKSGLTSPFYVDLRAIISYPAVMDLIARELIRLSRELRFDCLTGIPYTALPVGAIVSDRLKKPLVYQRKESKAYGTGKSLEGHYQAGQTCLVIDDVMTTGESKIEAAESLTAAGLKVRDFVIIVDRSFNGRAFLEEYGYKLHALVTMEEMVTVLSEKGLISAGQKQAVRDFMQQPPRERRPGLEGLARSAPAAFNRTLAALALEKKSNLILSLDVTTKKAFFDLLEPLAGQIAMVKTHVDILEDFDEGFVRRLRKLARDEHFLIFEDRKFADIGNTVRHQFRDGLYHIADWADCVTVHPLPGPGILSGLFEGLHRPVAAFILAAMSARGTLISDNYTRRAIEMGREHRQWVAGFIGFGREKAHIERLRAKMPSDSFMLMPGVNLRQKGDGLGQQYVSAAEAVAGGADFIIVGRGILRAEEPPAEARAYREQAWRALLERGGL